MRRYIKDLTPNAVVAPSLSVAVRAKEFSATNTLEIVGWPPAPKPW